MGMHWLKKFFSPRADQPSLTPPASRRPGPYLSIPETRHAAMLELDYQALVEEIRACAALHGPEQPFNDGEVAELIDRFVVAEWAAEIGKRELRKIHSSLEFARPENHHESFVERCFSIAFSRGLVLGQGAMSAQEQRDWIRCWWLADHDDALINRTGQEAFGKEVQASMKRHVVRE